MASSMEAMGAVTDAGTSMLTAGMELSDGEKGLLEK